MAVGLFSSFITLLSINFLGGFTSDGLKCSKVTRSYGIIVDRLYKMAWSARNYSVYAQIINGTGIFLTNIVAIGAILILTKISQVWIWSGFTLFGFLYGSALAYILRAGGTQAVREVADDLVNEFRDDKTNSTDHKYERLIHKED